MVISLKNSWKRLKLALQTFKDENISYEEEKKKLHGIIDKTNEFLFKLFSKSEINWLFEFNLKTCQVPKERTINIKNIKSMFPLKQA